MESDAHVFRRIQTAFDRPPFAAERLPRLLRTCERTIVARSVDGSATLPCALGRLCG